MNDTEVNKTIQQMVRFIKQEAEEKAAEIMVSAEEEFNITKLQLLEAERASASKLMSQDEAKLRREYERREAAIDVRKKVEYSKQLNESRIKVLQAREDAVQRLLRAAAAQLAKSSADQAAYRVLLHNLLLQAMRKLGETRVLVRCRAADAALVGSLLPQTGPAYAEMFGGDVPGVELDQAHPLLAPPVGIADELETCAGGVVVTSSNGKIVCSNTLDERLRIAYSQNLPAIRQLLFGSVA